MCNFVINYVDVRCNAALKSDSYLLNCNWHLTVPHYRYYYTVSICRLLLRLLVSYPKVCVTIYLLKFYSLVLSSRGVVSSISVIASFLHTTIKTVFSLLRSIHRSVWICCFNKLYSVIVSLQMVMCFSNSKCFSPQNSFTSCPLSVFPSIINKQSLSENLQIVVLIISLSKWMWFPNE